MSNLILEGEFEQLPECDCIYTVQLSEEDVFISKKSRDDSTDYQKQDIGCRISLKDVIGIKLYENKIQGDVASYFKIATYKRINKKNFRALHCHTMRVCVYDEKSRNFEVAETWARTLSWLIQNERLPLDEIIAKRTFALKKKYLVLVNPKSGQGKSITLFNKKGRPVLDEAYINYKLVITDHAGHATEIVRQMEQTEFDVIVISSGDGMIHEVCFWYDDSLTASKSTLIFRSVSLSLSFIVQQLSDSV